MDLLKVSSYNYQPAFCGKTRKIVSDTKILKDFTSSILSGTEAAPLFPDLGAQIKKLLNNPEKNKVFLTALASLLTAAAAQITDFITEDKPAIHKNKDNDTLEISTQKPAKKVKKETPDKINKHKGISLKEEKELLSAINDGTKRLNLDIPEQNKIIAIYNRFCGHNYKGVSYGSKNEVIKNTEIAAIFASKLNKCNDKKQIENIIKETEIYTSEKKELPQPEEAIIIPVAIMQRSNLKANYEKLSKEDRILADKLINTIMGTPEVLSKKVLQRLNKNFPHLLPQIEILYETLVKENNSDGEKLLTLFSNNMVSESAVENWGKENDSKEFDFFEYNSLKYRNIDSEAIKQLAQMKKSKTIGSINYDNYNEKFTITLPRRTHFKEKFKKLSEIFYILHNDSVPLEAESPNYTITDIDKEVLKNKDSYKKLIKYLSVPGQEYLNEGKMNKLLDIYNYSESNKELFTIHSYLRFIERYVLPQIKTEDGNYTTTQIRSTFKNQLNILKQSLGEAMNSKPIEVIVYSPKNSNIKAPKIYVPVISDPLNRYGIGIDRQGIIHTIF